MNQLSQWDHELKELKKDYERDLNTIKNGSSFNSSSEIVEINSEEPSKDEQLKFI